jgi:hypothetical protein
MKHIVRVQITSTPLSFAEPLLATKHTPDARHATPPQNSAMLTIEQRRQLDTFLAPFHTWTVGPTSEDASWQVATCFAPRLHRNGDIDFIAHCLAGSQLLALITAQPVVTFLVSDGQGEHRLEGRAQTAVVQQSWERAEMLAYLQWRTPGAIDGLGNAIEVILLRPTYLRYYDPRPGGGMFEVRWQRHNQPG